MQKLFMAISLLLVAAVVCPAQVTVTEYAVPTAGSRPYGITTGPDGNLWFTESFGHLNSALEAVSNFAR